MMSRERELEKTLAYHFINRQTLIDSFDQIDWDYVDDMIRINEEKLDDVLPADVPLEAAKQYFGGVVSIL